MGASEFIRCFRLNTHSIVRREEKKNIFCFETRTSCERMQEKKRIVEEKFERRARNKNNNVRISRSFTLHWKLCDSTTCSFLHVSHADYHSHSEHTQQVYTERIVGSPRAYHNSDDDDDEENEEEKKRVKSMIQLRFETNTDKQRARTYKNTQDEKMKQNNKTKTLWFEARELWCVRALLILLYTHRQRRHSRRPCKTETDERRTFERRLRVHIIHDSISFIVS